MIDANILWSVSSWLHMSHPQRVPHPDQRMANIGAIETRRSGTSCHFDWLHRRWKTTKLWLARGGRLDPCACCLPPNVFLITSVWSPMSSNFSLVTSPQGQRFRINCPKKRWRYRLGAKNNSIPVLRMQTHIYFYLVWFFFFLSFWTCRYCYPRDVWCDRRVRVKRSGNTSWVALNCDVTAARLVLHFSCLIGHTHLSWVPSWRCAPDH